jgi:glycosyltransferase involved in cell wall biosynthesis
MTSDPQGRKGDVDCRKPWNLPNATAPGVASEIAVTLLTGGIDRPYTFGLAMELVSKGTVLDVVGGDGVDFPEFHGRPGLNFLNLQGSRREDVSSAKKVLRLLVYYAKLIRYAATAKPRIFHILWNNKIEEFDRTLLTLFYRLLGKKIILTVHNVNAAKRDSKDTRVNRLTLRVQYRLADYIFVHTEKGKVELSKDFGVPETRIGVIPFGMNNAVPNTRLSPSEAKQRLGIEERKKAILFFGRIDQYKGLEYLIAAFQQLVLQHDDYRLIVAGRPENDCQIYWSRIQESIQEHARRRQVLLRSEHIPDDETELYFKAADVLVLPYRYVYQSGVLFLGYSFGLPVLAADVGSLKDEISEGKTGFVFKPEDAADLARTIERYFASDLYAGLSVRRQTIQDFVRERHSWDVVGQRTMAVYAQLLRLSSPIDLPTREPSKTSLDMNLPS